MSRKIFIVLLVCFVSAKAQDSVNTNKNFIPLSYLKYSNTHDAQDSIKMKIPAYKQGKICDFEDKLNRKKVPIDFSLGKSKY